MYGNPLTDFSENIRICSIFRLQEMPSCEFLFSTPCSQWIHTVISLGSAGKRETPHPWIYPHHHGITNSFDCRNLREHLLGLHPESHSSRSQKDVGHLINPLSLGCQARKQLKGLVSSHHLLPDAAENPVGQVPIFHSWTIFQFLSTYIMTLSAQLLWGVNLERLRASSGRTSGQVLGTECKQLQKWGCVHRCFCVCVCTSWARLGKIFNSFSKSHPNPTWGSTAPIAQSLFLT